MLGRRRSLGRVGTRDAHCWRYLLVVRAVTGKGRGSEADSSPASARNPARIAVLLLSVPPAPPQLDRHDTDTQSLQLLSEPDALGTRRRLD